MITRRSSSDASVFSRMMRDAQGSPAIALSEQAAGGNSGVGDDDRHRAAGRVSTAPPEGFADLVGKSGEVQRLSRAGRWRGLYEWGVFYGHLPAVSGPEPIPVVACSARSAALVLLVDSIA